MPKRLYKFTKAEFALFALQGQRLKISTLDDLNDPFDQCAVDTTDPGVAAFVEQYLLRFRRNNGILCFSRNWDNLLLWSHYGDSHAGICLGFDIPDNSAHEMEVHYQPNVIQIKSTEEIDEYSIQKLLRTKHESWSYEQESRMIIGVNDPPDANHPHFIEFGPQLKLREVIFGVNCLPKYFEPAVALMECFPDISCSWAYMQPTSFLLVRGAERPPWFTSRA
jgi:hypothetical protein